MVNYKKPFPFFLVLTIFICYGQGLAAQKKKVYNLVTDFGAKADNKTDCYNSFLKAADSISKAGGGTLVIPKGNYYVASYKIIAGNKKNNVTDIVFKNCNGLIVEGNNSLIRINGNFSRNIDVGGSNEPNYAYNNTVCVFKLVNCKDVLIKDISLHGGVDKMKKQQVVEGDNYGVYIGDDDPGDASSRILLQHITTSYFATDGIVIKSSGENIVISNCNSHHNARQGLSIVKGHDIKCLNSAFDSTGITGAYGWHAPGAGIDVENEFGPGKLGNVLIQNCSMRGNRGFQIETTGASENVTIDSCFISDLTAGYSDGLNGVGMYSLNSTLRNSILFATIQVDLSDQIYKGPAIQQIKKNLLYSGHRAITSADFGRPVNIEDNILIMLPKPEKTYFPYIQNPNCRFNRNIIVIHSDRMGNNPNPLVALVQYALEANEDFWLINGNDIQKNKKQVNYYSPALTDTKLVRKQFFPENGKISPVNFPPTKVLTGTQVDKILSAGLFTAYIQSNFNKKFLQQANEVRKYTAGVIAATKE
jgi:hypothetical protein